MEFAIQKLAVVSLFVIGLSHIFQPKAWAVFFEYLVSKGNTGSFINAFIHLPLGVLIVAFHHVWSGIPVVLTILGYAWTLKALIYFLFPAFGVRSMSRVSPDKPAGFVVAGVAMLLVAGLLVYSLFTGSSG